MIYDMSTQLARGEEAERLLDRHFADRFEIRDATRQQQRQGIDRIFIRYTTLRPYQIEYKTDWAASRTGNAFIETVSVDTKNIPGWAYTSRSQWLIYYLPPQQRILILSFAKLRTLLPQWVRIHKPAPPIPNQGYNTRGILVPLTEFEDVCQKIEQLRF